MPDGFFILLWSTTSAGYASDLSDSEWALLEPLLPGPSLTGRKRIHSQRLLIDAMLYVLKSGCAWRLLPLNFPRWTTVYAQYHRWRIRGVLRHVHDVLRERVRLASGRSEQPTAGIIDSQSAKTTEAGGIRGFDGAKKVSGRKRDILVDTLGLILRVVVHPADVQDREGGKLVLDGVKQTYPKLEKVWADQGYTGGFLKWAKDSADVLVEEVEPRKTFHVLPHRWVVERTFAWLGKCRRLSKDYEALPETTHARQRLQTDLDQFLGATQSAVLVSDTNTVRSTLGQCGVIDDQHTLLPSTERLSALAQEMLHSSRGPGTDIQKVVETLVGEVDVLSDGFDAFTFQRGQKASDVSGQADPFFGMVERLQTGRQEVGKGPLPVVWRRHV